MRDSYLIGVRGRDEDDRASSGDFPGSSRVNFAEEEIYQDGECPEDQIVKPWYL